MVKSELIKTISDAQGLSHADAEITVNTVFKFIMESLQDGRRVELRGFGSFGIKHRRARDGRNPKTGDAVQVPAKTVMFFKAGKELRERVDG